MDTDALCTRRLLLEPMSPGLAAAVMSQDWSGAARLLDADFPPEWRDDGWQWLAKQAELGVHDARYVAWGTRLARCVVGEDRAVLAEVGFHRPPDPEGWAEIGFRVVAEHRRTGLAREAVTALLSWAGRQGARGVQASAGPDNAPSLALLDDLGFTRTSSRVHPVLGELVVLRRRCDA